MNAKDARGIGAALLCLAGVGGNALAACNPNGLADRFAPAAQAMSQWEAANKTRLTAAARQATLMELCEAAEAAASSPGVSLEKIASASATAVQDYLTREATAAMQPRTMSAALRSALGVSGFSRPSMRRLGTLQINKDAASKSSVRVENDLVGDDLDFVADGMKLLLPPGKFRVFKLPKTKVGDCMPPEPEVKVGVTITATC